VATPNPRSLAAVDVAERFANGLATANELSAARRDAYAAYAAAAADAYAADAAYAAYAADAAYAAYAAYAAAADAAADAAEWTAHVNELAALIEAEG
jgi:hypothetical protein